MHDADPGDLEYDPMGELRGEERTGERGEKKTGQEEERGRRNWDRVRMEMGQGKNGSDTG
jgi:hypothetical protein